MRVTARGYSRNAGPTLIMDQEVRKTPDQTHPRAKTEVLYVNRKPNEVEMCAGPVSLTLSGRYWVTVQFTDEDIARLFLEAHPEFRVAVEAIYAKPPTPTAANAAE